MKRIVSMVLSVVFLLGVSIAVSAQTHTPSINNRERRQQKRIRQGVRSGSLTRREAARMEAQQARTTRA